MSIRDYANRETSARNGGGNPVPSLERNLFEGATTRIYLLSLIDMEMKFNSAKHPIRMMI